MNGKASKRLRLAVLKVLASRQDGKDSILDAYPIRILKRLKREYRECPYYRRSLPPGLRNHSHRENREQELARRGVLR